VKRIVLIASCAALLPCLAQAATVFSDNFNADAPTSLGLTSLPSTAGTNTVGGTWTVTNTGTVDIVNTPDYGITCAGASGACIDLNGTNGNNGTGPGQLQLAMNLAANTTYTATFDLSGNQRNFGTDNVLVTAGSGGTVTSSLTVGPLAPSDPFTTQTLTFTTGGTAGTYDLVFLDTNTADNNGNIGALLDNVTVNSVPLPAAAWLLLSGLAGMGLMARRRLVPA